MPHSIDATYIPPLLAHDRRATISYHANGHLARVAIRIDAMHEGELELAETPGSGHFRLVVKRGGYGTMITEDYRNGGAVTWLNTPWHDGEESATTLPWIEWVASNLAQLAQLTSLPVRPKLPSGRRRRA